MQTLVSTCNRYANAASPYDLLQTPADAKCAYMALPYCESLFGLLPLGITNRGGGNEVQVSKRFTFKR